MFGAFRPTFAPNVGLLWKMPWRMSKTRKMRQRLRLKAVDDVVQTVQASGIETRTLTSHLSLPSESSMPARDKYTLFSRKDVGYRKGIHKSPHYTKVTQRVNPQGF
ncbi:hypothetical protein JCM6882_007672 [Rhodosporidiobolus microsporus]